MDGLQRSIAVRAKNELAGHARPCRRRPVARRRHRVDVARLPRLGAPAPGPLRRRPAGLRAPATPRPKPPTGPSWRSSPTSWPATTCNGDDAIDAIRALRAALHGFVTLETSGGFGLPADIDRSFDRLVQGLTTALASWACGNPPEHRTRDDRPDGGASS